MNCVCMTYKLIQLQFMPCSYSYMYCVDEVHLIRHIWKSFTIFVDNEVVWKVAWWKWHLIISVINFVAPVMFVDHKYTSLDQWSLCTAIHVLLIYVQSENASGNTGIEEKQEMNSMKIKNINLLVLNESIF